MDARRTRHVLADHLADPEGSNLRLQIERRADRGREGVGGGLRVERDAPARELGGVDAPHRQIGVGHRGLRAALAVARWPRLGAGAFRPHGDAAQAVHGGDGAAARADLHHLDHRDAERQAAALEEAMGAGDLEGPRRLRLGVVDQADLGGGAAHVEGENAIEPAAAGDVAGEDGAAHRAGFHQADGKADCRPNVGDAAAREHDEERAAEARLAQAKLQIAQVARHDRLHVGVGAGGGEALVLAHLRRHLGRERDPEVRQRVLQDVADPSLVRRVDVGVQEADRGALDTLGGEPGGRGCDRRLVERQDRIARGVEPLGDGETPLPGHQRHRLLHVDVVLLETALRAHLDGIAETLGGDQRGARALALDHRVGGERGAVDDQRHLVRGDAARLHRLREALAHAFFGRVGCRQHLRREPLSPSLEHDIGEGAADIDSDPNLNARSRHR